MEKGKIATTQIVQTTTEDSITTTINMTESYDGSLANKNTSNGNENLKEIAFGSNNRPRSGAGPPTPKPGVVTGRINLNWKFLQLKCK